MSGHGAALEEIAGAILDGTPVNWGRIALQDTADAALLAELRVLATLRSAAAAAATSETGVQDSWGHLRILECVGRGASGEVYRAWDTRLDREVALKLTQVGSLAATSHPSMIEEGRLLARVRHSNVVTIYGAERIGQRIGLWMEYVKGRTLEEIVRQPRVFTPGELIPVAVQICNAVAAVHSAGVLHRDIKAHNVMVADAGRVVLMDFGTGLEKTDGSDAPAGTPLYLSPELLSGETATVQSDIYSVGVLLFRLLTGAYPVRATDMDDLRRVHAAGERRGIRSVRPDVPLRLARIIERAIDPDPARRYPSADAMASDLAALGSRPLRLRHTLIAGAVAATLALMWILGQFAGNADGNVPPARLAAGVASSTAGRTALAVLPFRNLNADPDSDYFADGLTNELIGRLARVEGLHVRAHSSSVLFKNKRNLPELREQLGVDLLVEGSVQRDERRVRMDVQLVRIAGDVPIWSQSFDRPIEEIFAVQDEISHGIVNKLRLRLGNESARYRTSIATYELYLRARSLLDARGRDSGQEAIRLLEQVIASDPSFAPAYAGLADAYASLSRSFDGLELRKALARMRPAALKALELDPVSAEAHAAMGLTYSRERNWEAAAKSYRKAIDLNPTLTHVYTNYATSTLLPLGKSAEAEQLLDAALQADPLSLTLRRELALALITGGRYEEAIANLRRVQAADPDLAFVDLLMARALTCAGRLEEALPIWDARKGQVGWEHWAAAAYVQAGRRAEVEEMLGRQAQPFQDAMIYAALGDKDRTFDALNRAVDAWSHRVAALLVYPEMALLRGDDRLDALRKRLGIQ